MLECLKIIYDARHIANEFSGLGRYSVHLLEGLIQSDVKISSLVILIEKDVNENNILLKRLLTLSNEDYITVEEVSEKVFTLSHYFNIRKVTARYKGYLYFYPHFDLPFGIRNKSIFVVHDLFPIIIKDYIVNHKLVKKVLFYFLCLHSLFNKLSDCVTVSDSTKNDLLRYFPFLKVTDVRVALSAACLNSDKSDFSNGISVPGRYLFYVGDRRPHKNLKKMIDVFLLLQERYGYDGYFIIAGTLRNFDFDLDEYIKGNDKIISTGPVTDAQLRHYYEKMDALFFMSKYEGFGLPVLESAHFNKKIITSSVSSLPEVAPGNSLLLNPGIDNDKAALQINEYLSSTLVIDNGFFLEKFNWKKTAETIFEL